MNPGLAIGGGLWSGQTPKIPLIAAAALVAFGAAPWGTWHLDDYSFQSGLPWMVRPLSWLTFRMNGSEPWMFLAVNLALHVVNAILVYKLLDRLAPALIFAVHPLCAEPVNYIFARPTLLAALFSLLCGIDWKRGHPWRACAWLALALASKEDALAVPLVILLFDRRFSKPVLAMFASRPLAAMFTMCAAAGAWSLYATASIAGSGAGAQAGIGAFEYLHAQGAAMLRYLAKFFIPTRLTLDPPLLIDHGWLGWWVVLLYAATIRNRFAWAALLLLLPSSSIVPLADLAADRRMYLSVAALAASLPNWSVWAVPVLAVLSIFQTQVWRTEESLWRHVERLSAHKLRPTIQLSRSVSPLECLTILEAAEKKWPEEASVPAEMGRCALQAGAPALALQYFGRALALDPANESAKANRDAAIRALTER
ncbi:MAG: hypothetical protein SFV18_17140 [Bryobacteraceae bacterium]|nr:hypothetical protein [Bryobacteraceae bacterium]